LQAQEALEPPKKRLRVGEVGDSDDEDESEEDGEDVPVSRELTPETPARESAADNDDGVPVRPEHQTAFESSLPAVSTDQAAIEEYETLRASQAAEDEGDTAPARTGEKGEWVRGRSSIYVDAFNLALDTVLEDEAHLFDEKEKCVFRQWRGLSYEAQYLLVSCIPPGLQVRAFVRGRSSDKAQVRSFVSAQDRRVASCRVLGIPQ
jgi:Fanconi-associated nuclease 1